MGKASSSNMSRTQQPQNTAPQNSMTNRSGLTQMLGMLQQMRASGQSPFGSKGQARTQQAQPAGVNRFLPQQAQGMPQAAAFQPVQQPAPRSNVPPMASIPPAAVPQVPLGVFANSPIAGMLAQNPMLARLLTQQGGGNFGGDGTDGVGVGGNGGGDSGVGAGP